ncbi:rhomboid family intramembrane serine protease [soil metagenome]
MLILPTGIDRPIIRTPFITIGIIIVNVVVYVSMLLAKDYDNIVVKYGYIPGYGSLVTLITHMFIHADLGHIVGNMFFLIAPGVKLEDSMGHWRFLLFYLGAGIAATLVEEMLSQNYPIPGIGASGAIAGVMGGFLMLYPFSNVRFMFLFRFRAFFFSLPTLVVLGLWFAVQVFWLVLALKNEQRGGVSFAAHAGGFATGMIWAWGFYGWNKGDALDGVATEQTAKVVFTAPGYPR